MSLLYACNSLFSLSISFCVSSNFGFAVVVVVGFGFGACVFFAVVVV